MFVPQPFEKDTLTEEEMIWVATAGRPETLNGHMLSYGWLKDWQEKHGSVKGLTMEYIEGMNL